jgi:hypothetical protein
MHVDLGQHGDGVGRILELDPVELEILAGREVTVAS